LDIVIWNLFVFWYLALQRAKGSSTSELRRHPHPGDPAVHVVVTCGVDILVFHVLQVERQRQILIQTEAHVTLRHAGIIDALLGLFGTVQEAKTDADIVLLAAPPLAVDVDAARV
jgi:hypothetical protein